jgi:hypothetical protein
LPSTVTAAPRNDFMSTPAACNATLTLIAHWFSKPFGGSPDLST